MSGNDAARWNYDDLANRLYSIAEKDICGYIPPKGTRARPFSKRKLDLTLDFASCGLRYYDCENRLLVLGRACGGLPFVPERIVISYDPALESPFTISKEAIQYSIKKETTDDLNWLKEWDSKKKLTPYLKLEKIAVESLNPATSNHWADCLAYSNLFKFLPASGGNPSTGLVRAQTNIQMAEILELEIKTLDPTHILLIVGENNEYWYPNIFREVIKASGVPHVKIVNRPEVRRKEIRRSIINSIKEWA